MELNDYIRRAKNPPKRELPVTFSAIELDNYKEIPYEKKKLLRAVSSHLSYDSFGDVYSEYRNKKGQYSYYQSQSEDGVRGVVRVTICTLEGSYDIPKPISKEKLDYEYNRCVKVGSQRYIHFDIVTYDSPEEECFDRHLHLFYTEDGGVFISSGGAEEIQRLTVDQLGNILANTCIEQETRDAYAREQRLAAQKTRGRR